MRRRAALLTAGLLAGASISMVATPAHAQVCTGSDPVFAYVCHVANEADPVGWINYYYDEAGQIVVNVVCDLWECP